VGDVKETFPITNGHKLVLLVTIYIPEDSFLKDFMSDNDQVYCGDIPQVAK